MVICMDMQAMIQEAHIRGEWDYEDILRDCESVSQVVSFDPVLGSGEAKNEPEYVKA